MVTTAKTPGTLTFFCFFFFLRLFLILRNVSKLNQDSQLHEDGIFKAADVNFSELIFDSVIEHTKFTKTILGQSSL